MSDESVTVDLGDRAYDIVIGPDALARAGDFIAPVLALPHCIIVTDDTVASLHLETLKQALAKADITADTIIMPSGEASKGFLPLAKLIDDILALGVERKTTLIALGGGVIGDLTGFAAAILLRGINFIQIATTLLAQVDSSVGGKTGINTAAGKNLVGAFHQPQLVLADTAVLDTLRRRDLLAGYAEVVKYGAISKPDFFSWLESHGADLVDGDMQARIQAVKISCQTKAEIVAQDEKEQGMRALLNLGHTFGHALESAAGYGARLLHGEAVAIGMVMAFDLSANLGLCPAEDAARLRRHLAAVGLPTDPVAISGMSWDADDLIRRMGQDKKRADGKINFILARRLGVGFVTSDVPPDMLREMICEAINP